MLKKLTIRNFKAIQDMTIEFTPLTVLIGGNSCGKSTVLQALDFLRSCAFRDIPEYLGEKGWNIEELKSQLNDGQNSPIEFISVFEFLIGKKKQSIIWHLQIDKEKNNWKIKEKIDNISTGEELLSYDFSKAGSNTAGKPEAQAGAMETHSIYEIKLQASWLKYYARFDEKPLLAALRNFLSDSVFMGLLAPDSIREGGGQILVTNIGENGVSLAAFIHNMSPSDRELLDKTVSKLIGYTISIKTIDLGRKIEIYFDEKFGATDTRINKDHASDGLLRIIAFVAITIEKQTHILTTDDGIPIVASPEGPYIAGNICNGMILLDEIENGINPYLTDRVISLLRSQTKGTTAQIILTTHSPVILNEFKPNEIVFMWKDKKGNVHARKFFDTDEMREALGFLNPGEIWENYGKNTILNKLSVKPGDK